MATQDVLRGRAGAITGDELMSYIINANPTLSQDIKLPVQGDKNAIPKIGQVISSNNRYKNAFIETVNLIALTVIDRNGWDNPWNFTTRGTMAYGDSIREIMLDLVDPHDYNEELENEANFIKTEVPNVFNHIHVLNYQKFYKTTTSDDQLSMAFESAEGLMNFLNEVVRMLYESMIYDIFLVDKYMLCRRALDGTITSKKVDNFDTLTARQKAIALKTVSNDMTFRKPNYNPAGIRNATPHARQVVVVDSEFEAEFSTDTLATSYFKNEADLKIGKVVLIDSFSDHDTQRLTKLLGDQYVAFTSDEINTLKTLKAVLMDEEWFQDRNYALDGLSEGRETTFVNPMTLKANHFLHIWRCFATSPFKGCALLTSATPAVSGVEITNNEVTVSAGIPVQLKTVVTTTGFANKAVQYTIVSTGDPDDDKASVDENGLVYIPENYNVAQSGDQPTPQITVTATSIYDENETAEAKILVV